MTLVRLRAAVGAAFGQARATHLASSLAVAGGLAACAAAWLVAGMRFDPPPLDLDRLATATTVPRELGALVGAGCAAWSAVTIVLLAVAIRSARSQQRRLDELVRSGDRFPGVLETVRFR